MGKPSGHWCCSGRWGTAVSLYGESSCIVEETWSVQGGRDQPLGEEGDGEMELLKRI